jgi:hypothetical protein
MQPLLHTRNQGLLYLRVHRIVPTTLSVAIHDYHQQFCALIDELTEHTAHASRTPKGRQLLKLLGMCIDGLLHPTPISDKQWVNNICQQEECEAQQRVIDDSPILTVPQLTNAPPIMLKQNPTAKCILKSTPRLRQQITHNNTPGILPTTKVIKLLAPIDISTPQWSKRVAAPSRVQPHCRPRATRTACSAN